MSKNNPELDFFASILLTGYTIVWLLINNVVKLDDFIFAGLVLSIVMVLGIFVLLMYIQMKSSNGRNFLEEFLLRSFLQLFRIKFILPPFGNMTNFWKPSTKTLKFTKRI